MTELRADILAALNDQGELTQEQLRGLIAWEAEQMGLTFDQAVTRYGDGSLPKTVLGMDVDLLCGMLTP